METKENNKLMSEFVKLICVLSDNRKQSIQTIKQANHYSNLGMKDDLLKIEKELFNLKKSDFTAQIKLGVVEVRMGFIENIFNPLIDAETGVIKN